MPGGETLPADILTAFLSSVRKYGSEAKRAQEDEKGKEAKDRDWWEPTEGVLCR